MAANAASMALARRLVSPPQAFRSSASISRPSLAAKSSTLCANVAASSKLRQISSFDDLFRNARDNTGPVLRMTSPQGHFAYSFVKSGVT